MTNEQKIDAAREELIQAQCELEEAAKIIYGRGLQKVAELFEVAAKKKIELAKKMFATKE